MKRIVFPFTLLLVILLAYTYNAYFFRQRTLKALMQDSRKVSLYSQWGYDTKPFEKIYNVFIIEARNIPFPIFPLRSPYLEKKHDNILLMTQAGYATEIANQKGQIQSRLTYLRERVKNETALSMPEKLNYSDSFEIIAGQVFEKNSDINEFKKGLKELNELDEAITKAIEQKRKESLISELQAYRSTCADLLAYFMEKESKENRSIAQNCIDEADKLMGAGYFRNGSDFLETLSRERVFTLLQKATLAKQQSIQEEQYARMAKQKEEERLSVVPPAPLQEGKVVVVNLSLQRLYAYENGASLYSAAVPITTGKQGFETVTGEFAIYLKEQQHKMVSPFPGIYYDDVVNYWMPFYLGYGLHDAPWRSIYGTQDYPTIGSHGCVNMPLNDTIILYNWAEVGTKVIVI